MEMKPLTLEQRLGETERRLMFLMQLTNIRKVKNTGMLDEHGRPTAVVVFEGNLLDYYMQTLKEAAEANEAKGNGHSGITL